MGLSGEGVDQNAPHRHGGGLVLPEGEVPAGLVPQEPLEVEDLPGRLLHQLHSALSDDAGVAVAVAAGEAGGDQGVAAVQLEADLGVLPQQVQLPALEGAVEIELELSALLGVPEVEGDEVGAALRRHGQTEDLAGVDDLQELSGVPELPVASAHRDPS